MGIDLSRMVHAPVRVTEVVPCPVTEVVPCPVTEVVPCPVTDVVPHTIGTIQEEDESGGDDDIVKDACPICMITLSTEKEPYVTACNHTFCQDCIHKYHTFCGNQSMDCPVCRTNFLYATPNIIQKPLNRPPFTEDLCPPNDTFDCIEYFYERHMIQSAYNTITRLNQWKTMHDYVVDEQLGFMHTRDPSLVALMTQIDDDYMGHSGYSLACTMRKIHFIAIYGVAEFKRLTCDQHT